MQYLTSDQIKGIAPDNASFAAARGLAQAHKWKSLGTNEAALWGECQGSGKEPYKVRIDRTKPGYACTCPSRKFPCKHILGLLLLAAELSEKLSETTAPDWVNAWLEKRTAPSKQASSLPKKTSPKAARRAAQREKLAATGIQALDRWLKDLLRSGLTTAPELPRAFWKEQAARLVDAQLPGAARMVHNLADMPMAGEHWGEAFLLKLARLYLLEQAYQRIETLPETTQIDVRSLLGWTVDQNELLASAQGLSDDWLVVGQTLEEDANGLRMQSNWLWSKHNQQAALILNFAHRSQVLDMSLTPGQCVHGELVYFPGAHSLRGVFKNHQPAGQTFVPSGFASLQDFLQTYSAALACKPWIESYPALLENVTPCQTDGKWILYDQGKQALPIARQFSAEWELMAISGGLPLTVFGLWDSSSFLPYAAWAGERHIGFSL